MGILLGVCDSRHWPRRIGALIGDGGNEGARTLRTPPQLPCRDVVACVVTFGWLPPLRGADHHWVVSTLRVWVIFTHLLGHFSSLPL